MGSPGIHPGLIRFGPFALDPTSPELRKGGYPVRLQPQALAVLLLLTERAGQIVSREEIHQHIWGNDTFVDFERGINFSINQIRTALGDDADKPRYVETIPRRGYRFIAAIENDEPPTAEVSASVITMPGDRTSTVSRDQDQINASPNVKAALITAPVRRLSSKVILISLVLLAILVAGLLGYHVLSNRTEHPVQSSARTPFSKMRITQLTSMPGKYWDPAFSPDGRQIAYFWDGENRVKGDLYVQLVGGEKPLRLTHTSAGSICCADWSPDGQQIVFGRCDDHGGSIFIIPALGGSERKLTDVVCLEERAGFPQWTADGKSLVLADSCAPDAAAPGIVVFSLRTGEKRCLHAPPTGDDGDIDPVLSPDQKTVAFQRWAKGAGDIYTVALSGGNLRQLTDEAFDEAVSLKLMWSPDGKYIVFEPTRDRIARVPASGGPLEYQEVYPRIGALSRDHRRLAYVDPAETWRSSAVILRANLANAGGKVVSQARVLVSTEGNCSPQLSPDEKQLVFTPFRSGMYQIWRSSADGSDPFQLTFFERGFAGTPRWSPDGRWIAFDYHSAEPSQIFQVDSEGRNLHVLVSGEYQNLVPSWSRDGKAIYFASNRTGGWQVWRRELSTGKDTQITQHGGFAAFESYDAKTLYYSTFEGGGIWKVPVGGGQEELVTGRLHRGYWGSFAVTDDGLYFVDSDADGGPAVLYYNLQTRQVSRILTLEKYPALWGPNLAASRDGQTLFYAQIEFENSTISMVEHFQ